MTARNKIIRSSFAVLFCAALSVVFAHPAAAELKIKHYGITSGRIAFSYTDQGNTDIWVLDFEKLELKPVISSPALDEYPNWSPDGQKLVFYSDMSGDREIHVANADGTALTRLTFSKGVDEDPHYSPDGKQIVFHSARLGKSGSNIFVMNADGSKPRALTNSKKKNSVPKWSPRGNEILYSTSAHWPGWDIMLYEFGAKKSKVLTSGFRSFCRAGWHPDGSKFAFSYGSGNDVDIWVQEKGGEPKQVTKLPGRDYDAVYTDDGKMIFFVNELAKGEGNYQLFVLDLNTNMTTQVTEGTGAIRHPAWTPFPEVAPIEEAAAE